MIATWMLYASLLGAVLGLGTLAAERATLALRLQWFPTRALWAMSLAATVLLPLVLVLRPSAPPPRAQDGRSPAVTLIARGPTLTLTAKANTPPMSDGPAAPTTTGELPGRSLRVPTVRARSTPNLDRALIIAWVLGTLGALAYTARSSVALARRRRRWPRQIVLGTSVLIAEDFGPALIGVLHPEIVLPAWALASGDASLELMLRHELEHRRAHDTLFVAACGIVGALLPWNASLWWQIVRLRLAAEIDCDARVLAQTGDARAYATVLVNACERMMVTSTLARAFASRRSLLERRIVAMSAARAPRGVLRAVAGAAIAALCIALACAAPKPQGIAAVSAPAPAQFTQATVPPQQYYPRVTRIDSVDAEGTEWLRAALARYYPRVLTADSSLAFVSFYLNADGRIVRAAARSRGDLGADTVDAHFPFDTDAYGFGKNAPPGDSARIAAERATFKADLDTMFRSQAPTASVLGTRTVLPREFTYDSLTGTSAYDPFLGADAHAFERDDEIVLTPGMVGPRAVLVHLLTLRRGRGGPADFGHRVVQRKAPITLATSPAPQPDIEHLGDLPGGGWAVTDSVWRTLTHKPVILIDGLVRSFADMMALAGRDTVIDAKRWTPAAAMRLTTDARAANGAIVVTTKGHRPPG